jgi:uncharacterized phage protein gp47/JayE
MPFKVPSLDETRSFLAALGKALFSGLNFDSRRSYHGRRTTYIAGAVTQIHAHVDSAARDAHPKTAGDGKPINDWGDATGVPRKAATAARKAAAGRVRGAAGETALTGDLLRHEESGLLFELASNVTIPGVLGVDPDSFFDADIVASAANGSVGSQTRLKAGAVLNFLAPPTGIQTSVVLQLDLDEDGFDSEQFGSYRGRVLSTFSFSRSGGSSADFVTWALAGLNAAAQAYPYPNRAGRGTIDVVAFYNGSGAARSLTSQDRDTIKAYIQTVAPFNISGDGGGLRVLTTVADPQNIEITLVPNGQAAFARDWDDSSLPTVLAWQPAGVVRKLQFSAALPASLRAGHRLVLVSVATAQDGREYRIESIASSDSVILEVVPPVAPAATDKIFSGGPLVTPVRDAIVAHLNGEIVYAGRGLTPVPASVAAATGLSVVGLDVLAEGTGPANPAGKYNSTNGPSWSGAIIRAVLFKLATYKAGVRNATVISPASDYEAVDDAFPLDDQIHYVAPGAVVVRYA